VNDVASNEDIKTILPDNKGIFRSRYSNALEWDEYLHTVRAAEILELGIQRVSPTQGHITPNNQPVHPFSSV
jgi:hypothetical protein